jgi:rSAM/selenodomain-associated transferase 1
LAAHIGDTAASTIYRLFVVTLLDRLKTVAARRVLVYTPADRRDQFAALAGEHWQLAAQADGSLGKRIHCYFRSALDAGAHRVVLLGSDSPTVPADYVGHALETLRDHPVVLGPTPDGGYYLIGLRDGIPPIFDRIRWSSHEVWRQTVQRLNAAQIPFATLPEWYDVDDLEDLERLSRELSQWPDDPVWDNLRHAVAVL